VKVGSGLAIDASTGVMSSSATTYTLPTATAAVLGGVKVGPGLGINNGILSATDTVASASVLGSVKVGGGLAIDSGTGVLSTTPTPTNTLPTKNAPSDPDQVLIGDSTAGFAAKTTTFLGFKAAIAAWYNAYTATLTNKTIDCSLNTVTNIPGVTNQVSGSEAGMVVWKGTQAQYDAITSKSDLTIYFIL
jgi:hypothetical protein